MDGNKRTAFLTGYVFLYRNGYELVAAAMIPLADLTIDENGYANWLREHVFAEPAGRMAIIE